MKYKVSYQEEGKIHTKYFYENEELPENIIKKKKCLNLSLKSGAIKISDKELDELFYELSIMLESNINFDEAINILIKNKNDKRIVSFLKQIKKSFLTSSDIKKNLSEFKINHLVLALLELSQKNGDVKRNISLLSKLLNQSSELKKSIYKTFTYPFILFTAFFFALIAIFNFVIPKFYTLFSQSEISMGLATKSMFFVKDFFENYFFFVLNICVILFFLLLYLYKNIKNFRKLLDKFLFKRFLFFSKIYRLKSFYLYFLFVEIMLESKYEFNEALCKAKVSINNQFLLDRISKVENLLKEGKSINFAFKQVKIFDDITLNLIRTGELTNSLSITIYKVNRIYQKRVEDNLKLFSVMIEPIFYLIIMSLIVWIILAIFVPLWNMSEMLKI